MTYVRIIIAYPRSSNLPFFFKLRLIYMYVQNQDRGYAVGMDCKVTWFKVTPILIDRHLNF